MTLAELKAELEKFLAANPALAAAVDEFGPAILAMAETDLTAFINSIINGRTETAWEILYGQVPPDDLLAAMNGWLAAVNGANAHVADEIGTAKSFFTQVANALLVIALAAAGV